MKKDSNNKMIPQAILDAAEDRIALGGEVERVGSLNGQEVFACAFSEEVSIGLPEFYVWDGKAVRVLSGYEAEEKLNQITFES